jgi:hypothetical protein
VVLTQGDREAAEGPGAAAPAVLAFEPGQSGEAYLGLVRELFLSHAVVAAHVA